MSKFCEVCGSKTKKYPLGTFDVNTGEELFDDICSINEGHACRGKYPTHKFGPLQIGFFLKNHHRKCVRCGRVEWKENLRFLGIFGPVPR